MLFGRKSKKEYSEHIKHEMGTGHDSQKTVLRVEGMTCMHCKM